MVGMVDQKGLQKREVCSREKMYHLEVIHTSEYQTDCNYFWIAIHSLFDSPIQGVPASRKVCREEILVNLPVTKNKKLFDL